MKAVWTILGWWIAAAAAGGGAGMLEEAWSGGDEFLDRSAPFPLVSSEPWPWPVEGEVISMGSALEASLGADMVMTGGAELEIGTMRAPIDSCGRAVARELVWGLSILVAIWATVQHRGQQSKGRAPESAEVVEDG